MNQPLTRYLWEITAVMLSDNLTIFGIVCDVWSLF